MRNCIRFKNWAGLTILFVFTIRVFAESPPGYQLAWSDEFNGTVLDSNNWDYWLAGPRRNAINVADAVSLDGSNLVITTYSLAGTNYTGMVSTRGSFHPRYGYWEARIKWGDTNGMWSAFWMQSPTMGRDLANPVESGSEIDIAEHRRVDDTGKNVNDQIQPNLHWNGYGAGAKSSGSNFYGRRLGAGFHTYGLLWTATDYTIFIDGEKVRHWNYPENQVPVSQSDEFVIFSSEVDDSSTRWAGQIPNGGYGPPGSSKTRLTVDYVRYYSPPAASPLEAKPSLPAQPAPR